MTNKELQKILKNQLLRKAVSPAEQWVSNTRHLLIEQAKLAQSDKRALFSPTHSAWSLLFAFLDPKALKRAGAGLIMTVFMFSSFVGIVSASNSLPGDLLYGVKIVAERAKIELAPQEQKALLRAEFAGRRLAEVFRVLEGSALDRDNNAKTAAALFQNEIINVRSDLDVLRASKAGNLAIEVDKKVEEYINMLSEQQNSVGRAMAGNLNKAKNAALETAVKSAEVIVAVAASSSELKEEAVKTVERKLQTLENQITRLTPVLVASSTPLSILEPAREAISSAKAKLDAQDLGSALSLLAQGAKFVSSAEQTTLDADESLIVNASEQTQDAAFATGTNSLGLSAESPEQADTVRIDLFFDSGL